jgi:nitrogen-specific signal transduction histidine kinase
MSSLAKLVAGVAHEINNPVSFIYGKIVQVNQYVLDLFNLIEIYQTYSPEFAA